jgi:anti-sigma regulatory factor (Ser/Thr protein kinase)
MTYPADVDAIGAARKDVVGLARAAGAGEEKLADIELAVSEAVTNALLHAYTSTGARGDAFTIAISRDQPLFSVWVTDEGHGAPPESPSTGLGLGLDLMVQVCERVLIGVLDDGRTQVEMRFDLAA